VIKYTGPLPLRIKRTIILKSLNWKSIMKSVSLVILSILSISLFVSCSGGFEIINKPVEFSDKRIDLTKEYIARHYHLEVENIEIIPKIIVLHWTAVGDFNKCYEIFNRQVLGSNRPILGGAGQVNVAIQFLVDRDGAVYRLMPENHMARHCIGINYNSIGVENVGGQGGIDDLTDEQLEANINLVKYLKKKYNTIEYLIGHYEYQEFEGHKLWLEKDDGYRTEKNDPGARFMAGVREAVRNLNLKGVEEIRREIQ
jgi:N-acetyl-anhydromuramyl-L-alanine amidase AmpD